MAKLPYSGPSLGDLLGTQARVGLPKPRRIDPKAIAAQLRKGLELRRSGNIGGARQAFESVLRIAPDHPAALHGLATLALAGKDTDGAINLLKRVVALQPKDIVVRCDLAAALLKKHDAEAARVHIRAALKLDRNAPPALFLDANCRAESGDEPGARDMLEALVARFPDYLPAVFRLAELCVAAGAFDRAGALYRGVASISATGLTARATALAGLTACEKIAADAAEAIELADIAPKLRPDSREYGMVEHALGKIAENSGDYAAAFGHFGRANAAAEFPFDLGILRLRYGTQRAIFTREFLSARRNFGCGSEKPVFIVGMPRSGTTLTEQIIASHPAAAGAGESPMIRRIARNLGIGADLPAAARAAAALDAGSTQRLAESYLAALPPASGTALRVTDKMPLNFEHLGLIALLFPQARIIHCRRDPLDVCVSCFTNPMKAEATPGDIAGLGSYYREYARLMEHWRAVLPMPIFESQYEDLVESFEERARALIAFVGLPWDPACLSFYETERSVFTPSAMQVRQPIYKSSVGRWRRYEKHLGPLKAALGDLVTAD